MPSAVRCMSSQGQFMDRKCINWRHFRQGSVGPTKAEYVWGDCLKAKEHAWGGNSESTAAKFAWADGFCECLEPKETSEEGRKPDS